MENEFIKYMILLEDALADFYKNIKSDGKYEKISPILEFMEAHSSEHADMIREMEANVRRPVIDPNLVKNYQNNITKSVAKRMDEERDLVKVLEILGGAEEGLGRLYDSLTGYVRGLSAYYGEVSKIIEKIAQDEYRHRDLLLNDRNRLIAPKQGQE